MRTLEEVAVSLAKEHRKADKKTILIQYFPDPSEQEIRLLEVSNSSPYTGEIMPFRFGAYPSDGVDYPSVVVLLNPEEWAEVKENKLSLPIGWDQSVAQTL